MPMSDSSHSDNQAHCIVDMTQITVGLEGQRVINMRLEGQRNSVHALTEPKLARHTLTRPR